MTLLCSRCGGRVVHDQDVAHPSLLCMLCGAEVPLQTARQLRMRQEMREVRDAPPGGIGRPRKRWTIPQFSPSTTARIPTRRLPQ